MKHVAVETYRIAAEHAGTGWDDFASAQLSFRYLMALALKFRAIKVRVFRGRRAQRSGLAGTGGKIPDLSAPTEIDRLYPKLRPARVTVTTARGKFTRQADEALGSRLVPLDDDGLKAKFLELVEPVHGDAKAQASSPHGCGPSKNAGRAAADRGPSEAVVRMCAIMNILSAVMAGLVPAIHVFPMA